MAGKKRLGFRPIDRYEEAKKLADWAMSAKGYLPCRDQPKQTVDRTFIQRLYTTHESRDTNHGGVSVAFDKDTLLEDHWTNYVQAQVELALSRADNA